MGMCARYDAIPSNPVRDTLRPKVERTPVATMTPEQFQDFYNHVTGWASGNARRSQQMLDAIDLLIATGCRPGELLALRFSDVDFRAGTITITGTLQRAGGLHRQEFTKTRHQTTLTLPSFALSVLRRRKLAAKGDMVFTSTGGGLWLQSAFSKSWVRARGKEWAWVKPSSFRKIVATMIERESGSVAASRQLGHVNDSITKLHYIAPDQAAVDSKVVLERFRGDA
jgi:integrase